MHNGRSIDAFIDEFISYYIQASKVSSKSYIQAFQFKPYCKMNFSLLLAGKIVKNASSGQAKQFKKMSTVAEKTIRVTFVDQEGVRATVPALIGMNLLQVAMLHKIDIAGPCMGGGSPREVRRTKDWVETTYGEGPACFWCHVQIASKYNSILPDFSEYEFEGIQEEWDEEATKTSRLACQITVDKRHDGMVIFVPDAPPTDIV